MDHFEQSEALSTQNEAIQGWKHCEQDKKENCSNHPRMDHSEQLKGPEMEHLGHSKASTKRINECMK
jgi:hypothetical protein